MIPPYNKISIGVSFIVVNMRLFLLHWSCFTKLHGKDNTCLLKDEFYDNPATSSNIPFSRALNIELLTNNHMIPSGTKVQLIFFFTYGEGEGNLV